VDVLIPGLKDKHVQPYVATWNTLSIQILHGRGLAVKDITGKSDPYVRIIYEEDGEEKKYKTKAKQRSSDPDWDDKKFEIKYNDNLHVIRVECYDKDLLGKDDLIGTFPLIISKIPTNEEYSRWFTLKGRKKKVNQVTGRIYMTLYKKLDSIENNYE